MAVRGSTPETRAEQRAVERRKKRVRFYRDLIAGTDRTRAQLAYACDYVKAVADDLDDDARRELAGAVAALADERNKP